MQQCHVLNLYMMHNMSFGPDVNLWSQLEVGLAENYAIKAKDTPGD